MLKISVAEQSHITGCFTTLLQQRREVLPHPGRLESLSPDQRGANLMLIPGTENGEKTEKYAIFQRLMRHLMAHGKGARQGMLRSKILSYSTSWMCRSIPHQCTGTKTGKTICADLDALVLPLASLFGYCFSLVWVLKCRKTANMLFQRIAQIAPAEEQRWDRSIPTPVPRMAKAWEIHVMTWGHRQLQMVRLFEQ